MEFITLSFGKAKSIFANSWVVLYWAYIVLLVATAFAPIIVSIYMISSEQYFTSFLAQHPLITKFCMPVQVVLLIICAYIWLNAYKIAKDKDEISLKVFITAIIGINFALFMSFMINFRMWRMDYILQKEIEELYRATDIKIMVLLPLE